MGNTIKEVTGYSLFNLTTGEIIMEVKMPMTKEQLLFQKQEIEGQLEKSVAVFTLEMREQVETLLQQLGEVNRKLESLSQNKE